VTAAHQKRMGYLDPAAYERTVDELMASGVAVTRRRPPGRTRCIR